MIKMQRFQKALEIELQLILSYEMQQLRRQQTHRKYSVCLLDWSVFIKGYIESLSFKKKLIHTVLLVFWMFNQHIFWLYDHISWNHCRLGRVFCHNIKPQPCDILDNKRSRGQLRMSSHLTVMKIDWGKLFTLISFQQLVR